MGILLFRMLINRKEKSAQIKALFLRQVRVPKEQSGKPRKSRNNREYYKDRGNCEENMNVEKTEKSRDNWKCKKWDIGK